MALAVIYDQFASILVNLSPVLCCIKFCMPPMIILSVLNILFYIHDTQLTLLMSSDYEHS